MSRRNTLPSLSSSRQMMMAWKVSGLSHSPAIIASRPASMRLAIAISPSRESSSTEPISRRYMRTGSSVRSAGSLASDLAGTGALHLDDLVALGLLLLGLLALAFLLLALGFGFLGFDDVDAHLVEHRQDVLDLLGGDLLGGQHGVELFVGDVAALLGGLDHLADAGVRQVQQRQRGIRRLRGFLLRRLFLLLRRLCLSRHASLLDGLPVVEVPLLIGQSLDAGSRRPKRAAPSSAPPPNQRSECCRGGLKPRLTLIHKAQWKPSPYSVYGDGPAHGLLSLTGCGPAGRTRRQSPRSTPRCPRAPTAAPGRPEARRGWPRSVPPRARARLP